MRTSNKLAYNKLYLAVALVLSGQSFANETESQEEMTVWGTQVSSSSEYLGDQDMSLKQADHMSDLLRDIPGVDVGGTHSVNQRINIRGLGESDLDIRLDGASQHANMFHHIGNLTLNPDILKSADIQVGNNSVTQSGLGGAVYFETKDAKDLLRYDENFGARIFGGYATNASQQGSLTLYGLLGDHVDAMIYGNFVERKNFEDGAGDKTYGSAGDVGNMLFKLGYESSDLHRFEFSYDMYRDSGNYSPRPDMSGATNVAFSDDSLIPTDYDRDTISLSYELSGEKHTGKVNVYSSTTEITRDESEMDPWPSDRQSLNTAKNQNIGVTAKFQSDLLLAGLANTFTYGAEYLNQNSTSTYGGVKAMDENAISSILFVEDKLWLTDQLAWTGGLRYENFARDAETSDTDFNALTWGLGVDWSVTDQVTLFANARSLFKGPELLETFVNYQDVTYLDDDIKPETGLNQQIGIQYSQDFGPHLISSSATVFKTDIDNYISETYQSDGSYLIENIGDAELTGFELSVSYRYDAFFSKLSYAKSDSKDKTNGGPLLDGNGRSADIGDSIALSLDYQIDSINTTLGWTSIVVLEEDNVEEDSAVKEGYDTHNLYAQWQPSSIEDLQVTFGIDNIFDELYVSHASRTGSAKNETLDDYEPGVNYKLSASYQF
ncbi:TonB-dependent siderophore receptor [Vibrio sp. MA40-2]|uniref:TonB-dependent siderophore receptor n=1 Tax=Vibrio sp. MA40-2 TaxID=3391828 RepID=UPI0039A71045